jgi:hypothetical protein
MALRRQRAGTGSSREFLREKTAVLQWPRLAFLEPLFAVIGAVGMRLYAPERTTGDLDIIVAQRDAPEAEHRLAAASWQRLSDPVVSGSCWRSAAGEYIDLFIGQDRWWPEMIAVAQANRDAQGLPILPLPGQVWLKLRAGRTVDAGDLSRLLGLASSAQIAEVRGFLEDHASSTDLEDFERLVRLGRLEFGSSERNALTEAQHANDD